MQSTLKLYRANTWHKKSERAELHEPKRVTKSGITYTKLLRNKNFLSAERVLFSKDRNKTFDDYYEINGSRPNKFNHIGDLNESSSKSKKCIILQSGRPGRFAKSAVISNTQNDKKHSSRPITSLLTEVDIHESNHISLDNLCSYLVSHGFGDPRDGFKERPVNNVEQLLRRRRHQKSKYQYYEEKLKGRARLEMEIANSKADAFIEQQRDTGLNSDQIWWNRFRHVFGNEFERMTNVDEHSMEEFGEWDEDRPRVINDAFYKRINCWLDEVHKAYYEN